MVDVKTRNRMQELAIREHSMMVQQVHSKTVQQVHSKTVRLVHSMMGPIRSMDLVCMSLSNKTYFFA